MPLTKKGQEIMANMVRQYGAKKAKQVFYASRNKGTITGVDPESSGKKNKFKKHHSCVPQFNGIENYHDRDIEIR